MMKLVYICGWGRSGSTVLELLMQHQFGVVPLGEFYRIFDFGIKKDTILGCGHSFSDCEFWRNTRSALLKTESSETIDLEMKEWFRIRNLPRFFWWRLRGRQPSQFKDVIARFSGIYRIVSSENPQAVLLDSSKSPVFGYAISFLSEIELHVIHLIRDGRAVAHSWQREKYSPALEGYLPMYHPAKSAFEWSFRNLIALGLRFFSDSYSLVRYETLASDPVGVLSKLGKQIGIEPVRPEEAGSFELLKNHTIGGNPMKFAGKQVSVKIDDEWKRAMKIRYRLIVGLLAFPCLLMFGYVTNRFYANSGKPAPVKTKGAPDRKSE